MSGIIGVLPDAIANQIAAGEVVQRPASAVKELLENALDADSTDIQLIIKKAGKGLIQVVDNGKGMSKLDARVCFERHATSKLKTSEDLFNINTLGFRGEALASIAGVAHVELRTRRAEDELGTCIIIEGSKIKSQEPCQCPVGTSISIKNLFYNIPARRNFLKSDAVEMRHIVDEFQRLSLAHSEVNFALYHNDVQVFRLPKSNLRKRLVNLFGSNFNEKILPLEEEFDFVRIYGFVGKPEMARKTRGEQFFFVNGRFIKSAYLNHSVLGAYEELLPTKMYPAYLIFIDIEPGRIDINVHPTKQEIKFEDEKIIYTFVGAAVKKALANHSLTPMIDFDQQVNFGYNRPQVSNNSSLNLNSGSSNSGFGNSKPKSQSNFNSSNWENKPVPSNWKDLYETKELIGNKESLKDEDLAIEETSGINTITLPSDFSAKRHEGLGLDTKGSQQFYQFHQRYIMSPIKTGLILVDQQAAHERILFERYSASLNNAPSVTQKLLFTETIELSASDAILLKEILLEVNALGYEIEEFGQNTFVISGVPAVDYVSGTEQHNIELLLEQYKVYQSSLRLDQKELLARAIARQNAVKRGTKLNEEEMRNLVDQLFACSSPMVAPNGKPTFITYSLEDIEKRFEKR